MKIAMQLILGMMLLAAQAAADTPHPLPERPPHPAPEAAWSDEERIVDLMLQLIDALPMETAQADCFADWLAQWLHPDAPPPESAPPCFGGPPSAMDRSI